MSLNQQTSLPFRERSQRLFIFLTSQPEWAHYLTSVVVVGVCTALLLKLQYFVAAFDGLKKGPTFVALYFIAIALSTVMGGLRAGLFSVMLAFVSTAYFLIPPSGMSIDPTMQNYMTLAIVLVVGSLVALGMEAYRSNTHLLVQNIDLLSAEQARADQEMVLNKIGQAVRTTKHPEQVMVIAAESVGQVLGVDRCYFMTYNSTQDLAEIEHFWRKDGSKESAPSFRVSDLGPDYENIYKKGRTVVLADTRNDKVYPDLNAVDQLKGFRSGVMVPLTSDGQLEMALVVAMNDQPREWQSSEIALVEAVASQTRAAVDAARLQQKEHNIAIQLQAALQPELSLDVKGLGISSFYRAALEEANVGGDFYDALGLSDGRTVFVLGDVSGKGLAAASQVAAIRHMLRCLLQTTLSLSSAIRQLNDVLIEQQLLPAFATLFVAVLNPADLMLEYVSCGHEPGLIYRFGQKNTIIQLPATGPVIGVFDHTDASTSAGLFGVGQQQLMPGDAVLLYTDGVSDAGADVHSLLGVDGITSIVERYHQLPAADMIVSERDMAEALLRYCVDSTEEYADGFLRDDICLLSLKVSEDYMPVRDPKLSSLSRAEPALEHYDSSLETEKLRRSLIADVLRMATKGKLRIMFDPRDLPTPLTVQGDPVQLDIGENVRSLRKSVREASAAAGLADEASNSLEMAAGEAANNSLVHAVSGTGTVSWDVNGQVQVRIEDKGAGIPYDDLPRATLERGYTTAGTLGQGFWIILQSVKRCWITTSAQGTIVVLEQDNADGNSDALPTSLML